MNNEQYINAKLTSFFKFKGKNHVLQPLLDFNRLDVMLNQTKDENNLFLSAYNYLTKP